MSNSLSTKKFDTMRLAQVSMLVAVLIVMQVTGIGFILIPPVSITIMHIPVIVGAIILGPRYGALLGGIMGLSSLINATFRGVNPIDLAFSPFYSNSPISSIIMCVGVRILIGLVAGLVFNFLKRLFKNDIIPTVAAAFLATLTNTTGVMLCLWLLFPSFNLSFKVVVNTIIALNFVLESGAAILFAIAFSKALPALRRYIKK